MPSPPPLNSCFSRQLLSRCLPDTCILLFWYFSLFSPLILPICRRHTPLIQMRLRFSLSIAAAALSPDLQPFLQQCRRSRSFSSQLSRYSPAWLRGVFYADVSDTQPLRLQRFLRSAFTRLARAATPQNILIAPAARMEFFFPLFSLSPYGLFRLSASQRYRQPREACSTCTGRATQAAVMVRPSLQSGHLLQPAQSV